MKPPVFRRCFDYPKSRLPNPRLRELEEGVHDIQAAEGASGLSVGYPGWNLLYYTALCSMRHDAPNVLVETGANWGCSTIVLAQALIDSGRDGEVHAVELDAENADKARENLRLAGVAHRVTLHRDDSLAFLRTFKPNGALSFVFLDGDHRRAVVVEEFALVRPWLDHKSIVFFDNTYLIDPEDGRVNQALHDIKKRHGGNIINFENTSWYTPGQAIWQLDPFRLDWERRAPIDQQE